MSSYSPPFAPNIPTKITREMFHLVVIPVLYRFTEDTLKQNPKSTGVYVSLSKKDGGASDSVNGKDVKSLAKELVDKGLIHHGAIRSFIQNEGKDQPIALQGMKPFSDIWGALGWVWRSDKDTYPFTNRHVAGIHLELHPELIKKFGVNFGNDKDTRFFKWFESEQYTLPKELVTVLQSGKDPMTKEQRNLLERIKSGENISDKEAENLVDGIYNFMSIPFIEFPEKMRLECEEKMSDKNFPKEEYERMEYWYSGVYSKINHVAFRSYNIKNLHEQMKEKGVVITALQGSYPLTQYGSYVKDVRHKWAEFIMPEILRSNKGELLDFENILTDIEHEERQFRLGNANALFPAATPQHISQKRDKQL